MDSVLLVDMSDPVRLYQQAKAVEAQRCLYDLAGYIDEKEQPDLLKVVDQSLAKVNQLVGQVMASRLTVRKPVPKLQGELALDEGGKATEVVAHLQQDLLGRLEAARNLAADREAATTK
jgi:hypothetical protein